MQIIKQKSTETFSARLVRQDNRYLITSVVKSAPTSFAMYMLQEGEEPLTDIKQAKSLFTKHVANHIVQE